MKKKICSLLLALLMVVTMLPVYQVSAVTKYNAGAALSYAKNHWNDGKGLCAEFVSDCLKAGGLSSWSTRCSALYRALYKEAVDGGIAKAYTLETNGRNYIRASSNSGKISNGDILFWYCSKCVSYDGNPYCHVAIVGGTDKDGDITVYQHFEGSRTQWNAIDIATEGNDPLRNATIHFSQPEPQPPVETSGTIAVSSVRARAGQTITVKVDLSANKGISNMRLQMSYPMGFTLESIQKGDALSTLFFTPPGKLTANPVNFVWDGTEADTSEGCILELTFRIADTVAVGEYSISLSYQKDDVLDGSLEGIDLALQSGTVSVVEFTRGDIDDDGVIGMKDLGALRKYFAGGYDAGNFVMEAADLDGDGVVTMKDLGVLRRYLAGGYDINLGE